MEKLTYSDIPMNLANEPAQIQILSIKEYKFPHTKLTKNWLPTVKQNQTRITFFIFNNK